MPDHGMGIGPHATRLPDADDVYTVQWTQRGQPCQATYAHTEFRDANELAWKLARSVANLASVTGVRVKRHVTEEWEIR